MTPNNHFLIPTLLIAALVIPVTSSAADKPTTPNAKSTVPVAAPTETADHWWSKYTPGAKSATRNATDYSTTLPDYGIQPGDILNISVWKEESLVSDVLVRPDGGISFPLVGDVPAAGKSVKQLSALISERLAKYIPDPVVTVAVKTLNGNTVYVIGKVNRAGEFPVTHYIDVMQALSMAGGTNPFAALNDIRILRRDAGRQHAIPFRYSDVEAGKNLEQNIILRGGDIVVVP